MNYIPVLFQILCFSGGKAVHPPFFPPSLGPPSIGDVQCKGDEEHLLECSHIPSNCMNVEDAGVICDDPDQGMI